MGAAPTVGRLTRLAQVASTQDLVHQLGEEGAPHGSAIVAVEQVSARGTRGRAWQAPPGGLWLSVLLRPEDATAVDVLSLRVGLAVARALEAAGKVPPIGLKWPNDLILGDRKLAGVLCEARWRGERLGWITVGVGINVANPIPDEVRGTAARLGDHDPQLTPDALAEPVRTAIAGVDLAAGQLSLAEVDEFGRRNWLRGRRLLEPIVGIAGEVLADGTLQVRAEDGNVQVARGGTVVLEGRS
ncbi:MAG TPA: biotin--[acetyl-CoA-carboxylase] ligase [Gemmatimonadales bacterium]|nr:biotin--[acetyl-CoA-carboxylase] ligase [Gemmatimonadales bacterium]